MKRLLKDWRIILLVIALLTAFYYISPSSGEGIVVQSVSTNSPFYGKLTPGESLSWANEVDLAEPADFYQFDNFTGVFRFKHSGQLDLTNIDSPGLGVTVNKKPTSQISLGMDLVGGVRVLLQPVEENVSTEMIMQAISTLETRINVYGLRESRIQPITDIEGNSYIQIEMAGGSLLEIEDLLEQEGNFEAKIPISIEYKDNKGTFSVAGQEYSVELIGEGKVKIMEQILEINDTFSLNSMEFEHINTSKNMTVLAATVFTGDDIRSVCMVNQPGICDSAVFPRGEGYRFQFTVFVSEEGAQKFADITKGMKSRIDPNTGESYLDGQLVLFLDENTITTLSISSDLAGRVMTNPQVTGYRPTYDEAKAEKLTLQSILTSGALPIDLETVKVDQVSPTLGQEFINSAFKAAGIAALAIALVIFIRYRKIKLVIPMVLWAGFELVLILGGSAAIGHTLDLASIAGIIAALGTGIDVQIMIIDEILLGTKEKTYTLKQQIKKAFFIVFSAATTTIAAMIPLMLIGIGVMRGFAIVTAMGILLGVFISRPAFGKFAEKLLEKDVEKE